MLNYEFNGTRIVLASLVLVVFFSLPTQVIAAGIEEQSLEPKVTHDFWLGPLSSQVYSFECLEGDSLDGSFTVTIDGDHFIGDQKKYDLWVGWGDGVDLYILDNQSHEYWLQGMDIIPLFSKNDVTDLSWSVHIPSSGSWFVLYDNDSPIYGKKLEGRITQMSQNTVAIIASSIIIASVVVLVAGRYLAKRM
ncbi:MAG: hypothetical protein ACXADS_09310 [Candidatus Thorarchaeota archaeon]|jgi:hypothetical protein